jgi:hypothetical protein
MRKAGKQEGEETLEAMKPGKKAGWWVVDSQFTESPLFPAFLRS